MASQTLAADVADAPRAVTSRVDLRTGAVAAGVVHIDGELRTEDWLEAMLRARKAWRAAGRSAPLSAPLPQISLVDEDCAGVLDAMLRAVEFEMRSVTLEVGEGDLAAGGAASIAALQKLRARGWGLALRMAPDPVFALGARVRSLFTDIIAPAPDVRTPLNGLPGFDDSPSALRIHAAAAAGITVTATDVGSAAHAGMLIAAGFDRGQGAAFAERDAVFF